ATLRSSHWSGLGGVPRAKRPDVKLNLHCDFSGSFVESGIRSLRSRYSNWSCQTSVQSNRMQIMRLKQLVCPGIAVLIFDRSLDDEATLRHRSGDRIRTAGKSRLFTANTHKEFTRFNFLIAVVVCHCHLCRCNGELKHSFFAGL